MYYYKTTKDIAICVNIERELFVIINNSKDVLLHLQNFFVPCNKRITSDLELYFKHGKWLTTESIDELDFSKPYINNVENIKLPMLAKKYNPLMLIHKQLNEFAYAYQYKLNGVRCKTRKVKQTTVGLFDPEYKLIFNTKEGNEYYMPVIEDLLLTTVYNKLKFNIELDGEFYKHGYSLTDIKNCVPLISSTTGIPYKHTGDSKHIDYVLYDLNLDIPLPQILRLLLLNRLFFNFSPKIYSLPLLLETLITLDELVELRDKFIDLKYEGLIIRSLYTEYNYGKRDSRMYKFKKLKDSEFRIIDVIYEGNKNGVEVVKVLLKNDINNETFISIPGDLVKEWSNDRKLKLYNDRNEVRGKLGTVSYYERSSSKKVPFHSNFIIVRDYE